MNEEWRPVVGFEGLYEVSSLGRVRSLDRTVVRSDGMALRLKGRLLKFRSDSYGYLRVALLDHGTRKEGYVHHLVLEAFGRVRPSGAETRHLDNCRSNNTLNNLEWGGRADQFADMRRHGTDDVWRGERNFNARLTEAAVRAIRQSPLNNCELARRLGVGSTTVWSARNRESWKHVR